MSTSAMKVDYLYKDQVAKDVATVNTGRNNLLVVSGMDNNGTLKFKVSVDGGTTFVEDTSLQMTASGIIVLHNSPAIIKVDISGVSSTSGLTVMLGF